MSENVTIKAEKKQDAKKKGKKRKEDREICPPPPSCVSAKHWAIKPLLLLLRCLSEKNSAVMKEHK